MRRFASSPMSPLTNPSSPSSPASAMVASAFANLSSSVRGKASNTPTKKAKASSPPRTPRSHSTTSCSEPGTPPSAQQQSKSANLMAKLLSPKKSSPVIGSTTANPNLTSPNAKTMVSSPLSRRAMPAANKTEELLESFIQGFKKAVPPSDKATNVRIAQFEDKEFLFVAEPSTQPPVAEEEEAAVVTLNSVIAQDLDLKLPASLLLDGTETDAQAEELLEAREKEVLIKTNMTRQLRARGFEVDEIEQALNTLDARLEAKVAEDALAAATSAATGGKKPVPTDVAATAAPVVDKANAMQAIAGPAVDELDAARKAWLDEVEAQKKNAAAAAPADADTEAAEAPQLIDSDLQAQVEKLQEDYSRIFQAEQPRLFMNFLQRGSFDKERNNADRRVLSSCSFLEKMALEEAAEQQAAAQAQQALADQAEAEMQLARAHAQQEEVEVSPKKKRSSSKSKKVTAKSANQDALVGAVESEEVPSVVATTAVDTDHLGLAETAMKFYVNKGKSVSLEKSAGDPTDSTSAPASPASPSAAKKTVLAPHQAGISLVALGVRMSDAKAGSSPTKNMPRVVSSHAYIIEGSRVGAMKKRANDLYHPLLLSTVSSPTSANASASSSPTAGQ